MNGGKFPGDKERSWWNRDIHGVNKFYLNLKKKYDKGNSMIFNQSSFSIKIVHHHIGDYVFGGLEWMTQLSGHIVRLDFFLWGYAKDIRDITDLKQNIIDVIVTIDETMLQRI